jgi:hypothetical protein
VPRYKIEQDEDKKKKKKQQKRVTLGLTEWAEEGGLAGAGGPRAGDNGSVLWWPSLEPVIEDNDSVQWSQELRQSVYLQYAVS